LAVAYLILITVTVEVTYCDLTLYDASAVTLQILWYKLISQKIHIFLPSLVQHT